jgi:hypothetical protein
MADYGRVVERNECLVQAVAAFDLRQFTYAPNELVAARGGVSTSPCSRAHKSGREDVLAPAKQGAEESNLFGRRPGCWYFSGPWQLYVDFRLNVECGKFGSQGGKSVA